MPLYKTLIDIILSTVSLLLLIPGSIAVSYYWILALSGIFFVHKHRNLRFTKPAYKFAIIIPAHNEEEIISATLNSLKQLQYPEELFDIYVIADNCTDSTADISRNQGFTVLERVDAEKVGKGFALNWALDQILSLHHHAVIILDADCLIDAHALKVYDYYLKAGALVLQSNDKTTNPDQSVQSLVTSVGNVIENDFYWTPKSDLGLPVFLRGTGMVFHKNVLKKVPWQAYSSAEDTEYSLKLLKNKIRIHFVLEASVYSDLPADNKQLKTQRTRWAGGNSALARKQILPLLMRTIPERNPAFLDTAVTLLVSSRPMILFTLLMAVLVSSIEFLILPMNFTFDLVCWSLSATTLLLLYFLLGFIKLGITVRRLTMILGAPSVVWNLIMIALKSTKGNFGQTWIKTPRAISVDK